MDEKVGEFFAGLIREALAAGWRYDRERKSWMPPDAVGARDLGRTRRAARPTSPRSLAGCGSGPEV